MHYWLIEYWNGTIGYYDTIFFRRTFKTANEALEWAEENCTRKFWLSKITY